MHIKLSSIFHHVAARYRELPRWARMALFIIVLSLPVFLYCLPLLSTGLKLAPGDADYLMQTEEAAYKTMVQYGQFPSWNPWVSGGVPLFANPQFGLISLPTLCVLLFGSIVGYKVALGLYIALAFWGMYLLFRKGLVAPRVTSILLSYIWAFSGYFALRIAGHYTFFTIVFFPFMLLLLLRRETIKRSWLYLGLVTGLMINAAAHNTSIMALAVFSLFALYELVRIVFRIYKSMETRRRFAPLWTYLKFLGLSLLTVLLVAGARLHSSLEYISEYPRTLFSTEQTIGVLKGIFALFGPLNQYQNQPNIPEWSWMEVGAYIGIFTGVAVILCAIGIILTKKRTKKDIPGLLWVVISLGILFFLLGLGIFAGHLSPYFILHKLPVFSGMRVATRWLVWASVMVLLLIALYRQSRFRVLINACLLLSVVELFIFGAPQLASSYIITPAEYPTSATISQQKHYDSKRYGIPYDENLTATTKSNIGQVIAGDSLLDTRQGPPVGISTIRCDSDDQCPFVLTSNATVTFWSPNKITLSRTAPGIIRLNMNPGKYWLVNNRYLFANMRLAEPSEEFAIDDTSQTIDIRYQPKYSPDWVIWRLTGKP